MEQPLIFGLFDYDLQMTLFKHRYFLTCENEYIELS